MNILRDVQGPGKRKVRKHIGDLGKQEWEVASLPAPEGREECQEARNVVTRSKGECVWREWDASNDVG